MCSILDSAILFVCVCVQAYSSFFECLWAVLSMFYSAGLWVALMVFGLVFCRFMACIVADFYLVYGLFFCKFMECFFDGLWAVFLCLLGCYLAGLRAVFSGLWVVFCKFKGYFLPQVYGLFCCYYLAYSVQFC